MYSTIPVPFVVEFGIEDLAAFADGDLMANPVRIKNAVTRPGACGVVVAATVEDYADQGLSIEFPFFQQSCILGAVNSALTISDETWKQAKWQGSVRLAGPEFTDFVNLRGASPAPIYRPVQAANQTRDLWVGAIARGAWDLASNKDLVATFWILQEKP